jgi:hypothetical protein
MDKIIYGADTETLFGKPMSMQFYSEQTTCEQIYFVDYKSSANVFLKWCSQRRRNVLHVVYIHNLSFDLIELLWGHHAKLASDGGDFKFNVGSWTIKGVYGMPTFCTISNGHNVTVMLIDSYSFFRGSLAKAAELYCPGLPKLRRPAGIGEKKFTAKDTGFCEYAMRDAVVAYHIGLATEALHQEFDIPQAVSIADMAARIFRHKFLSPLEYAIPQPSREVVQASLLSYHGGKNNCTVDPGWYEGVYSVDKSSAYPDALARMPSFSNSKLYKKFRATAKVREVPKYGVYQISGKLDECDWPVIFTHSFKPMSGRIADVWVQGFEVNEALRSGELKLASIRGHYYDHERDHQVSAFRGFVETFYALKEAAKNPILRSEYKFILNSISGKLIQTRKTASCAYTDIDAGTTVTASQLTAGGMFHPFIASAVTAEPRADMHRIEHKYKALHTATDGIMTTNANVKPEGKGLGALVVEARDTTLLLMRNKCYVQYGEKSKKSQPSKIFKGRHVVKFALHGFQGSVTDLERLAATGRRKYTVNKPHRLKESIKRGLTPNLFVKREYVLKVGPLPIITKRRKSK